MHPFTRLVAALLAGYVTGAITLIVWAGMKMSEDMPRIDFRDAFDVDFD